VWVGYSKAEISMDAVVGNVGYPIRVFGGTFPARIWHDYMLQAVRRLPVEDFPKPPAAATGEVPNVVGKYIDEAKKILADANFTALVEEVPSVKPAGEVVAQAPGAGASLELGSAVTVQVSNGKVPVLQVPNVIGLQEQQAQQVLSKAGFNWKVSYVQVNDANLDGLVFGQDPAPGTRTQASIVVQIVVGNFQSTGGGGKGKP
jgi:membrane peptidoglycan carboxypeptidase